MESGLTPMLVEECFKSHPRLIKIIFVGPCEGPTMMSVFSPLPLLAQRLKASTSVASDAQTYTSSESLQ